MKAKIILTFILSIFIVSLFTVLPPKIGLEGRECGLNPCVDRLNFTFGLPFAFRTIRNTSLDRNYNVVDLMWLNMKSEFNSALFFVDVVIFWILFSSILVLINKKSL